MQDRVRDVLTATSMAETLGATPVQQPSTSSGVRNDNVQRKLNIIPRELPGSGSSEGRRLTEHLLSRTSGDVDRLGCRLSAAEKTVTDRAMGRSCASRRAWHSVPKGAIITDKNSSCETLPYTGHRDDDSDTVGEGDASVGTIRPAFISTVRGGGGGYNVAHVRSIRGRSSSLSSSRATKSSKGNANIGGGSPSPYSIRIKVPPYIRGLSESDGHTPRVAVDLF
jgi:hypothetical protein